MSLMKTAWKPLLAIAALALALPAARAAHVWDDPEMWWAEHWTMVKSDDHKFNSQELSLDVFASYVAAEYGIEDIFETNIRDGDWGGGVGLNYFLTRHIGIGGDINIADNRGKFVDHALGSLTLRLPIETLGFAPYVFGGGGRGFDPEWEWMGHAGVGLEFRPNPVTGLFIDGRYIWADDTNDRLLLRAGLRLVF